MDKLAAGALLGALVAGAAVWSLQQPSPADEVSCDDRCGPGTACLAGLCVIDPSEVEEAPEEAPTPRKRRRRSSRTRAKGQPAGDTPDPADAPVSGDLEDDGPTLPEFSRDPQALDLHGGSERLSDRQVAAAARSLSPRFQRCVAGAGDTRGIAGEVRFKARVRGSGEVAEVSVEAPAAIRKAGILPCLRAAVAGHRFPSFDGPPSAIDLSFEIEG